MPFISILSYSRHDDNELDAVEAHDTNGDGVVNGSDTPVANTGLFSGVDIDGDGLRDVTHSKKTMNMLNKLLPRTFELSIYNQF